MSGRIARRQTRFEGCGDSRYELRLQTSRKDLTDAKVARRIDPQHRLGVVAVDAKVYEAIPEIAAILQRHRISSREYILTHLVAMVTAMADDTLTDEALRHEGLNEIPPLLMTPALKFWRSMDPALKAEAAEWKRMRGYDKGINR